MTEQVPLMQPSPAAQAAWEQYEQIKREIEIQHPEIQWGKLCFAYCGEEHCNCGASARATAIMKIELRNRINKE